MKTAFKIFIKKDMNYHLLEELKDPNKIKNHDKRLEIIHKNCKFLYLQIPIIIISLLLINCLYEDLNETEKKNFSLNIQIKGFVWSLFKKLIFLFLTYVLFCILIKLLSIKIDCLNESNLRKKFIELCQTILVLEDILKVLVKNPFYSNTKFKIDINSVLLNFKDFLTNLEIFKKAKFPLSLLDETLFKELNENKFDLFKFYLEKKKIIFDVIFDFYEDNKTEDFVQPRSLINIYKLNTYLTLFISDIQNLNKFLKNEIKRNVDREFKDFEISITKAIIEHGNFKI